MIQFYLRANKGYYAISSAAAIPQHDTEKLTWLFGGAELQDKAIITGDFVGPRKEMITPWSTNAVEISQNMGITSIERIEEYNPYSKGDEFDPMLSSLYKELNQELLIEKSENKRMKQQLKFKTCGG